MISVVTIPSWNVGVKALQLPYPPLGDTVSIYYRESQAPPPKADYCASERLRESEWAYWANLAAPHPPTDAVVS